MSDEIIDSVVIYTDASFTQMRGSRPNKATGGVFYACEGQKLSGFLMNLQRFSLYGSDAAETLTSILAIACAPPQYRLAALYSDCTPNIDRLYGFQNGGGSIKGLTKQFELRARDRISQGRIDFKVGDKTKTSLSISHDLAAQAKQIRDGVHPVSFDDNGESKLQPFLEWSDLAR